MSYIIELLSIVPFIYVLYRKEAYNTNTIPILAMILTFYIAHKTVMSPMISERVLQSIKSNYICCEEIIIENNESFIILKNIGEKHIYPAKIIDLKLDDEVICENIDINFLKIGEEVKLMLPPIKIPKNESFMLSYSIVMYNSELYLQLDFKEKILFDNNSFKAKVNTRKLEKKVGYANPKWFNMLLNCYSFFKKDVFY